MGWIGSLAGRDWLASLVVLGLVVGVWQGLGVVRRLTSAAAADSSSMDQRYGPPPIVDDTSAWRNIGPDPKGVYDLFADTANDRELWLIDRQSRQLFRSGDRGGAWTQMELSEPIEIERVLASAPSPAEVGDSPGATRLIVTGSQRWTGWLFAVDQFGNVTRLNAEPLRLNGLASAAEITTLFLPPTERHPWFANVETGQGPSRVGSTFASWDGGRNWMVWREGWRVLAVDPRDPNIIFAQSTVRDGFSLVEAGVEKTVDGGQSWRPIWPSVGSRVLSLRIAPTDSRIVFLARVRDPLQPDGQFAIDVYVSTFAGDGDGLWATIASRQAAVADGGFLTMSFAIDPQAANGVLVQFPGYGIWYRADHTRQGAWRPWGVTSDLRRRSDVLFDRSGEFIYVTPTDGGVFQRRFQRDYPPARLADCDWRTITGNESPAAAPTGLLAQVGVHVAPSNPLIRYLSTGYNVQRSTDGGATWVQTPIPMAEFTVLGVDRWDPDRLYLGANPRAPRAIGVAQRGFLYVSNAGEAPTALNIEPLKVGYGNPSLVADITRLFQFPSRRDLMYLAASGSSSPSTRLIAIFSSRDGGATWRTWLDNGRSMAVHPTDPTTFFAERFGSSSSFDAKMSIDALTDDGAVLSTILQDDTQLMLIHPKSAAPFVQQRAALSNAGLVSWLSANGSTWLRSAPLPSPSIGPSYGQMVALDPSETKGFIAKTNDQKLLWTPNAGADWFPVATSDTFAWHMAEFDESGEHFWRLVVSQPGQQGRLNRCRFERPITSDS